MPDKKRFFKCKKCSYSLWISVEDKYACQNCKMRKTLKKYNQSYNVKVYRTYEGKVYKKRIKKLETDNQKEPERLNP